MSIIYPPLVMVKNIIENFFKYRNAKFEDKLDDDKIISQLTDYGNIKIISDKIAIVIADKDHKCSKEKQEFLNMMKFIKDLSSTVNEIIIVLNKEIIESKKNITNEISNLQQIYPKLFIRTCPYERFTIDILAHKDVAKYRILSQIEITNLQKVKHFNIQYIKILPESDPPILWIGARAGDIVECEDKSLTDVRKIEYFMIQKI